MPLVIPVSVPVHKNQADPQGGWPLGRLSQGERTTGPTDRKPSVIVARRRSLKHTVAASFGQVGSFEFTCSTPAFRFSCLAIETSCRGKF